ncbi:MAG: hypothetical protein A2840_02525 [Candidatus Buchananbacteria bacterium RIFCSPHIGHO2_01_FULL_47_11b]|uniref:Glycosyltransferase 2-like domain-containing protein n=1 Tax=Candidatus Buchananbacteria bacterium RIFCSPHIGHO2_01_FULL_47_11b TaxID=1797537 RepID=A0A1G1Y348_9BACT|nr:MAG: hypothetical protein A2840_02525 [Candidatus Buchananbacteria bacterium RIFCSPHIGHO2_01_FULL_47_11b]
MQNTKKHSISVVLPCLNEEETLGASIEKAKEGITRAGLNGEVIIADNGSQDHSVEVAKKAGARVVEVKRRGYGAALMGGFAAAKGDLLVMGDADDTYDFREIPLLYKKYLEGYDFVSGNRLKGNIDPKAMPFIHRYIGVPALTLALNLFFWTGIWDGHCGLRLFSKKAYLLMRLNSPGMEFASEMLMKTKKAGLKMAEVPVSYGSRHTKSYSKLNTFRDGFRHLGLILAYAFGIKT